MEQVAGSKSATGFNPVANSGDATAGVIQQEAPSIKVGGDEAPGPDNDGWRDVTRSLDGDALGGMGDQTPAQQGEPARRPVGGGFVGCRDRHQNDFQ